MNLYPEPSLQQISVINIATNLWSTSASTTLFLQKQLAQMVVPSGMPLVPQNVSFRKVDSKTRCSSIGAFALNKAAQLPLPTSLKQQVSNVLVHVNKEAIRWLCNCANYTTHQDVAFQLLPKIHWSTSGYINERKTAESMLLSSKLLSSVERFKLACWFCLLDFVPLVWLEMEETEKLRLAGQDNMLLTYWACYAMDQMTTVDAIVMRDAPQYSRYEYMVQWCIRAGNETAVKYFWEKLTAEERNRNIVPFTALSVKRNRAESNITAFFLSQMTPAQHREIFQNQHLCFLILNKQVSCDFLSEGLYMQTLDYILDFVNAEVYLDLLLKFGRLAFLEYDYKEKGLLGKYKKVFKKLWLYPPVRLSQFVIERIIRAMFSDTIEDDMEFPDLKTLYAYIIGTNHLHLLDLFLQINLKSLEEIAILKQKLAERLVQNVMPTYKVEVADQFFRSCFARDAPIPVAAV